MKLNRIELYEEVTRLMNRNSLKIDTIQDQAFSKLALDLNGMSTTYCNGIREYVCN